MSKTLVVKYLPSADRSFSKKALEHFLASADGKTTFIHRDLIKTPAPAFDETSMAAYGARGFAGQALSGPLAEAIRPFDAFIDEIQNVDHVVFAFPTHNWSEPGVVKTYIDAISQYGKLIQFGTNGPEGVLKKHKATVIFASGNVYEESSPRRTIQPAFTFYLNAIGIQDVKFISVEGTLLGADVADKNLVKAKAEIDALIKIWYN